VDTWKSQVAQAQAKEQRVLLSPVITTKLMDKGKRRRGTGTIFYHLSSDGATFSFQGRTVTISRLRNH